MLFIDFFAGIGGFRLGMEMAGHHCVGYCEIDKYAVKSYRAMHDVKEDEWYASDIRNVKPEDLPEADCWCGGFPCQAFSIAGKRRGFEDMRGTLIFEIFRLAAERKPKIIFLENVAGLLNHDGGRTFATILCGFWELGYDVEWQVLNTKDFGVPQNRERVFIIGHLGGAGGRKVFPITGTNSKALKELISGSMGQRVYDPSGISKTLCGEGGGQGAKTGLYLIGASSESVTETPIARCLDANYYKGYGKQERAAVLEVRPCLTPDRLEKRQNGRRFKEDGEPMFTLTAQDKHGVMIIDDNVRIRRLTPKECFRLQGFPDEYFDRARAVNSDTQLYKQAGNSVTVNVIYEIAKRL